MLSIFSVRASPPEGSTSSENAGQQLLQLLQASFQSSRYSSKSVVASLVLFLGGSLVLFIVFCFLRPRHNLIYAPKLKYQRWATKETSEIPSSLGNNPFAWVKRMFSTGEQELVDKLGIDAALFIRFHTMCRNIFLVLSVLVCAVGIPINVSYNLKSPYGQNLTKSDAFLLMTPSLVTGTPLYAHVGIGWLTVLTVLSCLWYNYRKVIAIRRKAFASAKYQKALFTHSLLVTEIPSRLDDDAGLIRLMNECDPLHQVQQVDVGRDVAVLSNLQDEHFKCTVALESHLARYLKNPDNLPSSRPMCKPLKEDRVSHPGRVDAIEYYGQKLNSLRYQIGLEMDRLKTSDSRLPYGFVSYKSQPDCHSVAKTVGNSRHSGALIQLAPRPEDIIWRNIILGRVERAAKQWWGNFLFVLLMVVWIVPNAFIGCFLADLGRLGVLWPAFQRYMDGHETSFAILQGVLSPIVTSLIFLILPLIMRRMSQWQGKLTKNQRERDVTRKIYAFFFFNNFLVFTLMSVIWNVVSEIVQYLESNNHTVSFGTVVNQLEIGQQIVTAIINASSFWVMYMLKANLGAMVDLLQVFTLIWNSFQKRFMSPSPRQLMLLSKPQNFNYAIYYISVLFYCTIALAFTSLQPIIIPMLTFYLAFDILLKKYALMYMFVTKAESDGMYWPLVMNCLLFALGVGNLILLAVVWIQGGLHMAITVMPLPFVVLVFKIFIKITMDPQFYYFIPSPSETELMADYERDETEEAALVERYRNPVLSHVLPVPMVHAKAQHLLAEVCKFTDDNSPAATSQSGALGSRSGEDTAGFDIIQDSDLDYEHLQELYRRNDTDRSDLEYSQHETKYEYNNGLEDGLEDAKFATYEPYSSHRQPFPAAHTQFSRGNSPYHPMSAPVAWQQPDQAYAYPERYEGDLEPVSSQFSDPRIASNTSVVDNSAGVLMNYHVDPQDEENDRQNLLRSNSSYDHF